MSNSINTLSTIAEPTTTDAFLLDIAAREPVFAELMAVATGDDRWTGQGATDPLSTDNELARAFPGLGDAVEKLANLTVIPRDPGCLDDGSWCCEVHEYQEALIEHESYPADYALVVAVANVRAE